jgi:hypothetical protein
VAIAATDLVHNVVVILALSDIVVVVIILADLVDREPLAFHDSLGRPVDDGHLRLGLRHGLGAVCRWLSREEASRRGDCRPRSGRSRVRRALSRKHRAAPGLDDWDDSAVGLGDRRLVHDLAERVREGKSGGCLTACKPRRLTSCRPSRAPTPSASYWRQ